jgi:hypothetical protein
VGPTLSKAILVDSNSNVFVSGQDTYQIIASGPGQGYNNQFTTVKYDSNGVVLWISPESNFPRSGTFNIRGITLDPTGDLYIEAFLQDGQSSGFSTFKYATNGNIVWLVNDLSGGYGGSQQATGLAMDSGTNLLVTGIFGYTYTQNSPYGFNVYYCYATSKLNSAGAIIWTSYYPPSPFGFGGANAITVDSANNVYVTGYSSATNFNFDIVTIKYGSNGNQVWLQRYNGPGNGNDAGNAIAVDNSGNVYVTGYDTLPGGGTEIVTIKYSALTLQRQANGTVLLQAQGSPGESFDVQASTDLQIWQDLGQSLADTNGFFQFDDTNAPQYNARFYLTLPQ